MQIQSLSNWLKIPVVVVGFVTIPVFFFHSGHPETAIAMLTVFTVFKTTLRMWVQLIML